MRIAEFAKAIGVSTATVRRWDSRGMIRPRRDWTGARRFTQADVKHARALLFTQPAAPSERERGDA
jgi:DNA-binding transcriptional MerR regulator